MEGVSFRSDEDDVAWKSCGGKIVFRVLLEFRYSSGERSFRMVVPSRNLNRRRDEDCLEVGDFG